MILKELIKQKAVPDMIVISDIDGVHTTCNGGVKMLAQPSSTFGALFTFVDGMEVLELVPKNESLHGVEIVLAGSQENEVWEHYQFHTPDGQGIQHLLKEKIRIIVTSGRDSAPVRYRFCNTLKYVDNTGSAEIIKRPEVYLGVKDKLAYFTDMELNLRNVIFISDGHQDAPLLQAVKDAGGIAVSTADGEQEAQSASGAITKAEGGKGAFAEVANAYLDFIKRF